MRARERSTTRQRQIDRIVGGILMMTSVLGCLAYNARTASAADDPLYINATWTDALIGPYDDVYGRVFREDTELPVDVDNTLATGDMFSKRSLMRGQRDMIVSGTRLTTADLSLANGAEFIEVPVSATGLTIGVRSPVPDGFRTVVCETTEDDYVCGTPTPYTGPIPLRPSVIMRQLGLTADPVDLVNNLEFQADVKPFVDPTTGDWQSETGATSPIVMRSDPGALTMHVQQYLKNGALDLWKQTLTKELIDPEYAGEAWPLVLAISRSLDSATINTLVSVSNPSGSFGSKGGHMALLTLGRYNYAAAKFPSAGLRPASLTNAAGKWVIPTKESVLAGIEAGLKVENGQLQFTEDAALTDATATDAYPLTWMNWLMAPASGLSADKANAIAAVARYLATDGQAALDVYGEPHLPQSVVDLALAQADKIVESNCTGAGKTVTTRTDAGPYAPAALPAGVSIKWCEATIAPAATTTVPVTAPPPTTAPATTTSTAAPNPTTTSAPAATEPPANTSSSGRRRTTTTTSAPAPTEAPSTVPPVTSPPGSTPSAVVDLPFGSPVASRSQFDRTTTMLLGGGVFFVGLRRFRRKHPS